MHTARSTIETMNRRAPRPRRRPGIRPLFLGLFLGLILGNVAGVPGIAEAAPDGDRSLGVAAGSPAGPAQEAVSAPASPSVVFGRASLRPGLSCPTTADAAGVPDEGAAGSRIFCMRTPVDDLTEVDPTRKESIGATLYLLSPRDVAALREPELQARLRFFTQAFPTAALVAVSGAEPWTEVSVTSEFRKPGPQRWELGEGSDLPPCTDDACSARATRHQALIAADGEVFMGPILQTETNLGKEFAYKGASGGVDRGTDTSWSGIAKVRGKTLLFLIRLDDPSRTALDAAGRHDVLYRVVRTLERTLTD